MSVFSNIMEKLGFFKKKAVDAVVETAKAEEIPLKIEEASQQVVQNTEHVAEEAKNQHKRLQLMSKLSVKNLPRKPDRN